MWFWFLWLFNLLGLGGALTVWSLLELLFAIGTMIYVLGQGLGIVVIMLWPEKRVSPTIFVPESPVRTVRPSLPQLPRIKADHRSALDHLDEAMDDADLNRRR